MHRVRTSSLLLASLVLLEACHSSSSDQESSPPPAPNPVTAGLDARPSNLTCVAPPRTGSASDTIALQQVFAGIALNQPLAMLQAPGDDSRWFVLEKGSGSAGTGRVRVFANTVNAASAGNFLSLTVNAIHLPSGE